MYVLSGETKKKYSYTVEFAELSEQADERTLSEWIGQAGVESESWKARRENLDPLPSYLICIYSCTDTHLTYIHLFEGCMIS